MSRLSCCPVPFSREPCHAPQCFRVASLSVWPAPPNEPGQRRDPIGTTTAVAGQCSVARSLNSSTVAVDCKPPGVLWFLGPRALCGSGEAFHCWLLGLWRCSRVWMVWTPKQPQLSRAHMDASSRSRNNCSGWLAALHCSKRGAGHKKNMRGTRLCNKGCLQKKGRMQDTAWSILILRLPKTGRPALPRYPDLIF